MKLTLQIGLVFAVCFAGQTISSLLPIAIPGTIICMVILFLLLAFRVIKTDSIRTTADFFLKNMAFFFVPAGVGIIASFPKLKGSAVSLIAIVLISTVLVFGSTALTVSAVVRLQEKFRKGRDLPHE